MLCCVVRGLQVNNVRTQEILFRTLIKQQSAVPEKPPAVRLEHTWRPLSMLRLAGRSVPAVLPLRDGCVEALLLCVRQAEPCSHRGQSRTLCLGKVRAAVVDKGLDLMQLL